jgi:lipoprotein-anchoring transpeptidase ErfK/SrfK
MNNPLKTMIAAGCLLLLMVSGQAQTKTPTRMGATPTVSRRTVAPERRTGTRLIVVSLEDRRLALVEDGAVKKLYRVAVGREATPSPTGTFTIVERVENPTYYHEGVVVPPGSGNPVGARWMGLSVKGYGIHGTNAPRSIGKAASHGCIRMRQRDLEELFDEVRIGDTVEIVGERNEETVAIFGEPAAPGVPASVAGSAVAQTMEAPVEAATAAPNPTAPVVPAAE